MLNAYSPKRFYLTFPKDNFWNFNKILNVIKKKNNNIYVFIQIYNYSIPLFWLALISFFSNLRETFFSQKRINVQ